MTLARTYARALAYLAAERREVATICFVNLFLAAMAVLEPVTLGKVFDAVSDRSEITPALVMWGALGVFNIIGFVFVARQSDRLSHRNRLALLARNYEKVMALPLSWHHKRGTSHALHTLLRGIDTLSGLWLEFMRQHLSTAIALIFLLPTAIYLDWRLTVVLIALGVAYMTISRIVMKKTEQGQRSVERYHHQVFSHVSDTISNVSLLQSYHRVAAEVQSLRGFTMQLAGSTVSCPELVGVRCRNAPAVLHHFHGRGAGHRRNAGRSRRIADRRTHCVHRLCRAADLAPRPGRRLLQPDLRGPRPPDRLLRHRGRGGPGSWPRPFAGHPCS